MDKQRLLQTLAELRAEIGQIESVDRETAELLDSAVQELKGELDKLGLKQSEEDLPASSGLKDVLLKFESEHPQLAEAVGKVADALAALGI